MREFFKPWRRRIGCVTLMIACGLSIAWLSSEIVNDCVYFAPTNGILSDRGRLHWWRIDEGILPPNRKAEMWINSEGYWVQGLGQIHEVKPVLSVSYWSMAVPVTLISAYLLLWQPRTKPSINAQPEERPGLQFSN